MKNPIKQYFLLMSEGPFIISVIIIALTLVVVAITLFFISDKLEPIYATYAPWFFGLVFINMCLSYFIKYKYITEPCGGYNVIAQILITKEGKKIISNDNKNIWAKGMVYYIYLANSLHQNWKRMDKKTNTNCYLEGKNQTNCLIKGRYKNSLVLVPVTISLDYDGYIDLEYLFEVLIKNTESKPATNNEPKDLSIEDYLKVVFQRTNEKRQAKFDEIISRYAKMEISDSQFLNEIIEVVEFPERIFPCVTDTKICLGAPQTSACKGMMC